VGATAPAASAKRSVHLCRHLAGRHGDVVPAVTQHDVAPLDEDGVVAPGISGSSAVRVRQGAVELRADAEADLERVATDPGTPDPVPHLKGCTWQVLPTFDVPDVPVLEGRLHPVGDLRQQLAQERTVP
jgi:hypothetical protein